jgi:hypothetical protein
VEPRAGRWSVWAILMIFLAGALAASVIWLL